MNDDTHVIHNPIKDINEVQNHTITTKTDIIPVIICLYKETTTVTHTKDTIKMTEIRLTVEILYDYSTKKSKHGVKYKF